MKACQRLEDRLCPGSYKAGESTFRRIEWLASTATDGADSQPNQPQRPATAIHFTHEYLLDVGTAIKALKQMIMHALDNKSSSDFEEALVYAFRLSIDVRSIPEFDALCTNELIAFPRREHYWILILLDYADGWDLESTLLEACESGFSGILESLFWRGVDINCEGEGQTLLEVAVDNGDLNMVNLLLSLGADPNFGCALVQAFRAEHPDIAIALMRHGARIDELADDDLESSIMEPFTVLLEAVASSQYQAVERALSLGADPNAGKPLLITMATLESTIACLLVKHGANVSVKDDRGQTPLHFAAGLANLDLLEAILAQNSSPEYISARDDDGNSALDYAIFVLEEDLESSTIEHVATKFLHAAAEANTVDSHGKPVLSLAVDHGETGIVETLLGSKAWFHRPDEAWLFTAFDSALLGDNLNCVRALLEAEAQDKDGALLAIADDLTLTIDLGTEGEQRNRKIIMRKIVEILRRQIQ